MAQLTLEKHQYAPRGSAGPTAGVTKILHITLHGNIWVEGRVTFLRIHLCRDTYADAMYFTYNGKDDICKCKPEHDVDRTRQAKNYHFSGNVNCESGEYMLYLQHPKLCFN